MSFRNILGQDRAIRFLKEALAAGRLSPSLLFSGPAGVGKRLAARELAKALNCEKAATDHEPCDACVSCRKIESGTHPDVIEVDFALQAEWEDEEPEKQTALKIDSVRQVERHASLRSSEGTCRVVIFDPAQDFTEDAANALLKLLEETPPRFQIVLIAQDESALLPTIRSRCTQVRFERIPASELARHLAGRLGLDPAQAAGIAARSGGSLGRALWQKEWGSFQVEAMDEPDLASAFAWMEQFSPRQGGRTAALSLLDVLVERERARLAAGEPGSAERLRLLLAGNLSLHQNVTPHLVIETLYLRFRRLEKAPAPAPIAPVVLDEEFSS